MFFHMGNTNLKRFGPLPFGYRSSELHAAELFDSNDSNF